MEIRVFPLLRALCLLAGSVLAISSPAATQIRISAAPAPKATNYPQDQAATTLALNLCVESSTTYPCPTPITSDGTYIPAITLTYGQVLDGVVVYGPPDLSTGTIILYKDTTAVCTLVIGVDHACPTNSTLFDVGDYTLTATLTFLPGSPYTDSTAAAVTISIAQDPTSIALTSTPNPAALGSPVTFNATVSGSFPATPTGQVVFTLDSSQLPAVTLDATGTANFTASTLTLGTHTMTASYAGTTDFLPDAEDATLKQQIVPPPTITTVASSLNPSSVDDTVTFTSTVSTAGPAIFPTGAVTFKDGTASFATVLVTVKGTQNVAQAAISTLAAGTHSITAIYSGDTATSPSVSKPLVQQVNYPITMPPPGYTITVTPASVSLVTGAAANLIVTVTPLSGFSSEVALSCSNLPNESTCTFGDATIPIGGGTTTLTLTTMSPHDCNSDVPYGGFGSLHLPASIFGKGLRYGVPALAGMLLLALPCRRRVLKALLSLIAVVALTNLTGCGNHCTDFGTSPGHYTLRVVGAAPAASSTTPTVAISVALSVNL